jgi:serine phosphatase RsbU (regulator of sigma subunit)
METDRMHCMEVWGGNRAAEKNLERPGIRLWVYCRPYGESRGGGDVYYVSSCASGRISRILLADVSGHGELAAGLAISLRDLMRRNVNMVQQTRFVGAMNQQFTELAQHGGFATALVTTYFAPTRSLSICNAGHPPPFIRRALDKRWKVLSQEISSAGSPVNMPLGVVDSTDYVQFDTRLDPGDLLLSFSDAITEARDARQKQLGIDGVGKLVKAIDTDEPAQVIPRLLQALQAESADNLDQDDVTVFLAQATRTKVPLKDNLMAPLRLLQPVKDATALQ